MRAFLLLACPLALTACASLGLLGYYDYDARLVAVEAPSHAADSTAISASPGSGGTVRYGYSDDLLAIAWTFSDTQLDFTLTNRSPRPLRVVWDDAVFVGTDGEESDVYHDGIGRNPTFRRSEPSEVAPGRTLTAFVAPTDRVYHEASQPGGGAISQSYRAVPLVDPVGKLDPRNFGGGNAEEARANVGRRFSVVLPLEAGGERSAYTFVFEVTSVNAGGS